MLIFKRGKCGNSFPLLLGLVLLLNFVHKGNSKFHLPSLKLPSLSSFQLSNLHLPNFLSFLHHGDSKRDGDDDSELGGGGEEGGGDDEDTKPKKKDWRNYDYAALEKSRPNTIALIQQAGYPAEVHVVTTSDGYILTLHRIPHGRDKQQVIPPVNGNTNKVEEKTDEDVKEEEDKEKDKDKDKEDEDKDLTGSDSDVSSDEDEGKISLRNSRDVKSNNSSNKPQPSHKGGLKWPAELRKQSQANNNNNTASTLKKPQTTNAPPTPSTTPKPSRPPGPPCLLLPGFMASSEVFFINGQSNLLPYNLVDEGYDVWIGNFRGSSYSNNHTSKTINSTEFWDFGFDEIGTIDIPAFIDYILNETGYKKLNLIAHSMGATVELVMLSQKPEMNDKINMSILLAPVAHMTHVKSPMVRSIAAIYNLIPEGVRGDLHHSWSGPFWVRNSFTEARIKESCNTDQRRKWCAAFLFLFMGFDYCQTNMGNVSLMTSVYPSGTSARCGIHYEQLANTKGFVEFDYGPYHNYIKYGQFKPPKYNLNNVKAPHTLFWADNDYLATPLDVNTLTSELPKTALKESCRVKFRRFNHLDFLVARDLKTLVNDRILRVLRGDSCREGDYEDDFYDDPSIKCNFFEDWSFLIPKGKDGENPIIETATSFLESIFKYRPKILDRLRWRVDVV